jgi:pyrophosphatase PpaX
VENPVLKYKTVLFDLDGTIIDTNELIITTFLHVLGKHFPDQFKREDIIPIMGEPLTLQMERFGGSDKRDFLVQAYREYNEEIHDEFVREIPHVRETLQALHDLGVTMGIVTTKARKTAEMGAKLCGLDSFMSTFIAFEDTDKHKPSPDPILLAMDRLQVDPATTLMVGDSQYDIQAAQNAGVHAAAVAWSVKGPDYLMTFDPTYMLRDMSELVRIVKGES